MKSKAEQLAEERYPVLEKYHIDNEDNKLKRAAFIAGWEAATQQCKWAVVDKDEIYLSASQAAMTIPEDFQEQMLIVKIIL
jgi:hypothetical protein